MLKDSETARIWTPAGARNRSGSSALGSLLRYLFPGTAIGVAGATFAQPILMLVGVCLIAQWIATRDRLEARVGAIAVRGAGIGMIVVLLMYVVSPTPSLITDLTVLSLAVIMF